MTVAQSTTALCATFPPCAGFSESVTDTLPLHRAIADRTGGAA